MTQTEIIKALKEAGLRPLKSLGQNFLVEKDLCKWIARQIESSPDEHWVEIGPGLGALTRELLQLGAGLTAIELDQGLARWLKNHLHENDRFQLIEGDAVKCLADIPEISVLAGNLPYNASTPIVVETLLRPQLPAELLFTLQKETGERFCAGHSSKAYGAITVFLQSCYEVECLRSLPRDVFYPQPNVDSVVFRATRKTVVLPAEERKSFYQFLRRAFAQRRKKLRNTIDIDDDRRPEHLSVDEWVAIFRQ